MSDPFFFVNQSIRLFELNDNVCTNIQRLFNTNCNFIVDYFLRYWYKEARWRACLIDVTDEGIVNSKRNIIETKSLTSEVR